MRKMSSKDIRNEFLKFFKENDHMQITDSSIVPKNDPTLLFINSGMAPIKNYFTGVQKPPYPRLCNVQPCIRTIDMDSIGDKHHLTSFQMLGSWSINDYFKEGAITFAYTLLTKYIGIPKEKLYVTVFSGDEKMGLPLDQESYDCWLKIGVPEDHIVKCGKEDNFWGPTSETGPCGPCTEIFYDTGDGEAYIPGGEFDTKKRYIEIWNAGVFMQLNKNSDGTFSKLAFNSVDTGAGLERLAMVLGGHSSTYDTDLLLPIKQSIENEIKKNGKIISEKELRILTDHLRTSCIILSEKVTPSNEGRGYTPRKLIRRCMMIISKNKVNSFDFSEIVKFILNRYFDIFPLFKENFEFIVNEFEKEYKQFEKVLVNGLEMLEEIKSKKSTISASEAFELVTTYGLPFDIISQYALENNISVDEEGFNKQIEIHREKSKSSGSNEDTKKIKDSFNILQDSKPTEFKGYEVFKAESTIEQIVKDGSFVASASKGDELGIVLDKTSMYAESGGQCSDIGYILGDKFKIKVNDVKKNKDGVFLHLGTIESGEVSVGDKASVEIDELRRKEIMRNHTAVHLLHSVLRRMYGKELHQAGSKVEDKKLRFDFNYENAIKEEEIIEIEKLVNEHIRNNIARNVEVKDLSEAISSGAMALFESKYGDKVRVVNYGDISSELCGGTHVERTGDIGLFIITSVEGIGKGMKRITALTGNEALLYVQNKISDINSISKLYKVKPENLVEKLKKESTNKKTDKSDEQKPLSISEVKYLSTNSDIKLGYVFRSEFNKKINSEVIKLAEDIGGVFTCICGEEKKQIILAVANKVQEKLKANEIISKLMVTLNGKGGGNNKVATGGTTESKDNILNALRNI